MKISHKKSLKTGFPLTTGAGISRDRPEGPSSSCPLMAGVDNQRFLVFEVNLRAISGGNAVFRKFFDQQRNFPSSPRKDQDFWALKSGRKGPRSSLFLRGGGLFHNLIFIKYLVVDIWIIFLAGCVAQEEDYPVHPQILMNIR